MSILKSIAGSILREAKREISSEVMKEASAAFKTTIENAKNLSDFLGDEGDTRVKEEDYPALFAVDRVFHLSNGKTMLCGIVKKGAFAIGDEVTVKLANNDVVHDKIIQFEVFGDDTLTHVTAGKKCSIRLENYQTQCNYDNCVVLSNRAELEI